ncbi:ABC transporter substrate-binding protein [Phototrophicus methaneseepsis]|uniref:ABC transporter substrate-binding protein n=1 Tax=Phototrophicus methaneseepsis TaxID=2710758 RepID=A0A7S8E6M3_9CHLR|nr:ABC transporter substrate-binding protein [Phototrophicus methaneseepsis]QPC81332.1 ABC transporter substrate-binding protein [Phototrophicus methaneseepsis]
MKKVALFAPLLLVIALVTGMGFSVSAQTSGGVLHAAHDAEWTGLDPHVASTVSSFYVLANVVESLTTMDDNIEIAPLLATEWEQSEDGNTWTFHLREGVLFSNGEELTADTVVFSMNRILNPDTGSGRVSSVGGPDAVWEAVDTYTVTVTTPEPNAILPILLTNRGTSIVHPDSVDENGVIVVPIGTGPFTVEDLDGTISMTLAKNENYWQEGLPYLDAVEVTVIQEDAAREAALLGGEVDFITSIAPQAVEALQENPDVEVQVAPALAYKYLGLNLTREPLDNKLVRQAIAYAINREEICAAGDFGLCTPLYGGPIDTSSPWYFDYAPYEQDLDKARELLAEAGYPDGFEMELMPTSTYQDSVRQAQVLQAQLAQVGITTTINAPEWAEWLELEGSFQFDGYLCSWNGLTDVENYYYLQHRTDEVFNFTGYSNPEFDALVDEGRTMSDFDERYAIYEQANQILVDDAPYVYFYNPAFVRAMSPNVEGYVLRSDNANLYMNTWLGEGE